MPSPEEPIEPEAAPPEAVPPAIAPPSFGLSGSIRQDDPQQAPGVPSSPWWAPENLGEPDTQKAPEAPEAAAAEAAVPERASGAAPADHGVVTPSPEIARPGAILPPPRGSARPGPAGGGPATMPMAAPVIVAAAQPANGGPPADGDPLIALGPPSPADDAKRGFGGRRRLMLMGAGAVAAVAAGVAGITALSGSSRPEPAAQSGRPGGAAAQPPSPSPSNTRPRATGVPSIDSEKTDRRPLRLSDVFPARPLALGGRTYKQDTTSVNHDCALVARGALAAALVRGHCRSVVRATYVDTKKRLAVTAGVVAMPTRALAVAARRAGAPSQDEWFRGMPGAVAKDIDQAGGYAASTIRGRYIIYSYTAYLDGHAAAPDDRLVATVGRQFVAYAVRPIERRSR